MADPPSLLTADRIDVTPARFVGDAGEAFATFDARTQDSGNVSWGIRVGQERFFIKTTDRHAEAHLDWSSRVALLRNAARLAHSCAHHTLPRLLNVIESPDGPLLVYEWVDGELLGGNRQAPDSAHQRFCRLPVAAVSAALDALYDLHVHLAQAGWVAGDFYDGSLIYDFARGILHVVDLDSYSPGICRNEMGRMFGSSRFMAPEEFERGRTIDERTSVFTMGRTAAVFLAGGSLERSAWRGSDALHAVLVRACDPDPGARFASLADFAAAWRRARASE